MAKKQARFVSGNRIIQGGTVTIDFQWLGEGLEDRFSEILLEEWRPLFAKVEARAKQLCPVGSIAREGTGPTSTRKPGTLRKSIKTTVARRRDKTAVLGFAEAGNDDAYYAVFVEFGTQNGNRSMAPHPYLRPAFNENIGAIRTALDRAWQRLERELAA